jgi:hypothetical protein
MMELKCFKTCKNKFVGGTDAPIRYGDVICALFGGNLPYILRPHGDFWLYVGQG